MNHRNVRTIWMLLVTTSVLVPARATEPAAVPRPPDGTYVYKLHYRATTGTSTIVFKSAGPTIAVQERADLGDLQVTTTTTLDAGTLREIRYSGASPQEGSFSADVGSNAVMVRVGNAGITLSAVGGLPLIIADGLISSAALIPAIVRATGARTFTIAALNGGKAFAASVDSVAISPPPGVPAGDAAMKLTYAGASETLWYQRKTMVLDALENQTASFEVRRTAQYAGGAIEPTVTPTPVPLPPATYATRTVSFPAEFGAQLAGTLTIPADAHAPLPAIVMLPGSGPEDRDETVGPNKIFLQLANLLSNSGYIVLRYDKRGIGASTGAAAGADLRQNALADAQAAFRFAQRTSEVDKQHIYLLGHSEGAMSAAIIASTQAGVRGIILLGGPALPLAEVVQKQRGYEELSSVPAFKAFLQSWEGYVPAVTIARVTCPILILQGGKDIQILATDLPRLVDAAEAAKRNVTVRLLPDDDHLFLKLPPDQPSTGAEYFEPAHIDPALGQAILNWLSRN
jgi:uncharacterized protein